MNFQSSSALENQDASNHNTQRIAVLAVRLVAIMLLVAALTMHMRSMRVFQWEQTVSGGLLVTYLLGISGLALCAASASCKPLALQAYLCSTGAALLLVNAGAIRHRWNHCSQTTMAVAELLVLLGVPLRRQVMIKVFLCSAVAVTLMLDLATGPIITFINK